MDSCICPLCKKLCTHKNIYPYWDLTDAQYYKYKRGELVMGHLPYNQIKWSCEECFYGGKLPGDPDRIAFEHDNIEMLKFFQLRIYTDSNKS